jgi:hypothetical protein
MVAGAGGWPERVAKTLFFTRKLRAPLVKATSAHPAPMTSSNLRNQGLVPGAAFTSHPPPEYIDQNFEMRPTSLTDQGLDPEEVPLEKIVDVEKALPYRPAPAWGSPATHDTNSNSLEDGSRSSDGNILPIFIPRSRYSK